MPRKTKELNEEIKPSKTKNKSITTKKVASKESKNKSSSQKKTSTKTNKKATSKPVVKNTKSTSKKTNTKTVAKKTTKKAPTKKVAKKAKKSAPIAEVVEYYDLPYRYNETIVKILYQTPNTLFVYWDISDKDRENYIKQYGENFFNITRPVLIIHNDTMGYSFEVEINDFANSWYLHINDSKCNYRVELGRRPNYYNEEVTKEIFEKIHSDYIYVSDSNKIESPNDHVLFNTNANNTIIFKNVKTQAEVTVSLYDLIKRLPGMQKIDNLPYISEDLLKRLYSEIYQNEDISLFDRISNPSSGSTSSGSMPFRIK